jgi:hypothetical protein
MQEGIGDISFVLETADLSASADELRKVLVGDEETTVATFRQLREVRDWVEHWGGRMVVSTPDNQGILIKLVLKRHRWMSDPRPAVSQPPQNTGAQK